MNNCFTWFLCSLFLAWLLTLVGFDFIFIQGIKEVFGKNISHSGYYFMFGLFGALGGLVEEFMFRNHFRF